MIAVDYPLLKAQINTLNLIVHYVPRYDNSGVVNGYVVLGSAARGTLRAEVTSLVDVADFNATLKPWSTPLPVETDAQALGLGPLPVVVHPGPLVHLTPISMATPAVAAGGTGYVDFAIPDLSGGMTLAFVRMLVATAGDEIVTGKAMVAPIGTVAIDALAGDVVVTLQGPLAIMRLQAAGGVLAEGRYLGVGGARSTAAALNAAAAVGINPAPESPESCIRRVGTPIDVGGGQGRVVVDLFTGLTAPALAGTPVSLIQRWIGALTGAAMPLEGVALQIGDGLLRGNAVPAGTIIRMGYKNNGGAPTVGRWTLGMFY